MCRKKYAPPAVRCSSVSRLTCNNQRRVIDILHEAIQVCHSIGRAKSIRLEGDGIQVHSLCNSIA